MSWNKERTTIILLHIYTHTLCTSDIPFKYQHLCRHLIKQNIKKSTQEIYDRVSRLPKAEWYTVSQHLITARLTTCLNETPSEYIFRTKRTYFCCLCIAFKLRQTKYLHLCIYFQFIDCINLDPVCVSRQTWILFVFPDMCLQT